MSPKSFPIAAQEPALGRSRASLLEDELLGDRNGETEETQSGAAGTPAESGYFEESSEGQF